MAKTKRFRTRRSEVTLVVVCIVVVALAAFFIYRGVSGDATAAPTYTTGTVQKMTLTSSVVGHREHRVPDTASVSPAVSRRRRRISPSSSETRSNRARSCSRSVNPQLDVDVANAQNAYDKAVLAVEQAKAERAIRQEDTLAITTSPPTPLSHEASGSRHHQRGAGRRPAENAVTSAEIALQDAKDNAAARTVTAPMAGVITALSLKNGDELQASTGGDRLFRSRDHHRPRRLTRRRSLSPSPTSARSNWVRRPS